MLALLAVAAIYVFGGHWSLGGDESTTHHILTRSGNTEMMDSCSMNPSESEIRSGIFPLTTNCFPSHPSKISVRRITERQDSTYNNGVPQHHSVAPPGHCDVILCYNSLSKHCVHLKTSTPAVFVALLATQEEKVVSGTIFSLFEHPQ